jgi:transcriptional regulator with XRE-family HTH domain
MTGTITDTHRYLRAWRVAKGWKLEGLAAAIGSKKNTISGWENGRRRINLDDLKKLADVYKVKPQELLSPPEGLDDNDPNRRTVFIAYDSGDPQAREMLTRLAKSFLEATPATEPPTARPPPRPTPGGSVAATEACDDDEKIVRWPRVPA